MATRLDRPTSIYLNGVRFLAAVVVFLGHVSGQRLTGGLFWQLNPFMDLAVMVFFVLSGFVIAYVTDTYEKDLRSFAINRTARIYSVALPALALTFVLDRIGISLRPDLYSMSWGFSNETPWLQYIASATFTNRIWGHGLEPGSNLPYWSLGFEVWYYIIFGAFFFLRGAPRFILGLFAAFVAGPNIVGLFPIWLMGFAVYHLGKSVVMPRWQAIGLFAASILLLVTLAHLDQKSWINIDDPFPTRYLAGAIFSLNIIAFRSLRLSPDLGRHVAKPIDWLAGMTFSLYLFHLPTAQFLATIMPWETGSALARICVFGGTFLIVMGLAEITERRKNAWRNAVSGLFEKVVEPEPALDKAP